MKYYAVKVGRIPAIYTDWAECERQVKGFSGAKFKSFPNEAEALEYMNDSDVPVIASVSPAPSTIPEVYAFTDGSYNPDTKVYGYGGFLVANGEEIILQGSDNDPELATMRNVAGEIAGAMRAVVEASNRGLTTLTIYYDYMGIEKWAKGEWSCNKKGTIAYRDFMKNYAHMNITFVHVKGHSGIEGNERADKLAKEAVGVV